MRPKSELIRIKDKQKRWKETNQTAEGRQDKCLDLCNKVSATNLLDKPLGRTSILRKFADLSCHICRFVLKLEVAPDLPNGREKSIKKEAVTHCSLPLNFTNNRTLSPWSPSRRS